MEARSPRGYAYTAYMPVSLAALLLLASPSGLAFFIKGETNDSTRTNDTRC